MRTNCLFLHRLVNVVLLVVVRRTAAAVAHHHYHHTILYDRYKFFRVDNAQEWQHTVVHLVDDAHKRLTTTIRFRV
jgi:hypothetical protein